MPTYEYRRPDGTTFEAFQKMSAPALTEDPETGVPVRRVISGGAGLQFKGDGFYETDYVRKSKSNDSNDSSDSDKPKKESASSSKPDKKASSDSTPAPAASTSTPSSDE